MRASRLLLGAVLVATLAPACSSSGSERADVVAYFVDAGDLVVGGQVQVNDVEIGRVTDIELVTRDGDMTARVEMEIGNEGRIPAEGLSALIRQTSLLGEQFVELVPQSTGAPFVGDAEVSIPVARTDRRVDIETFLSDLSGFIGAGGLEDLNRFTHAQAVILEDRGRELGESIEQLEMFTGVLADRKDDIAGALDHLASAGTTLSANMDTLDSFFDSLEDANVLLADESDGLRRLISSFRRFGAVNARFLARHEDAINRGFKALRPILAGLAGVRSELRTDITQLALFFSLFSKSIGGGPGDNGLGDYIQADAVLCEALNACHTNGEKGDVPGEGS